jgi:hypothetical protein
MADELVRAFTKADSTLDAFTAEVSMNDKVFSAATTLRMRPRISGDVK